MLIIDRGFSKITLARGVPHLAGPSWDTVRDIKCAYESSIVVAVGLPFEDLHIPEHLDLPCLSYHPESPCMSEEGWFSAGLASAAGNCMVLADGGKWKLESHKMLVVHLLQHRLALLVTLRSTGGDGAAGSGDQHSAAAAPDGQALQVLVVRMYKGTNPADQQFDADARREVFANLAHGVNTSIPWIIAGDLGVGPLLLASNLHNYTSTSGAKSLAREAGTVSLSPNSLAWRASH
jgi:hypothetical protein